MEDKEEEEEEEEEEQVKEEEEEEKEEKEKEEEGGRGGVIRRYNIINLVGSISRDMLYRCNTLQALESHARYM